MAAKSNVRRYSQAVFDIALETRELDRWQTDLEKIVSVAGDATFMALLESPRFYFDRKAELLSKRLKGINPVALNLVLLLVSRGRLSIISDIAGEYRRLLDGYRGIESAVVTTAVPLDDRDRAKLTEHLGALVGKKMVLKCEVDPGLIGGIVVRIDGKLLDGSTRSKLTALKRELIGAGK